MADSPASSLSEHGSEEFEEEVKLENPSDMDEDTIDMTAVPPSKKQKTGSGVFKAIPDHGHFYSDISSDTSGEAPSSPSAPNQLGDDDADQQVTICRWRGCTAGDRGNMDELVKHIHDVHVLQRQKKYACEWEGCSRIDATHASGYALRAHMRSHTREKPFYCALPECDKAFTRSDALAKHMRTVHETEALRPSDPVPRNHSYNTATHKPRLKLNLKPQLADGAISPNEALEGIGSSFTDLDLTPEEAGMTSKQLYRLWRRQVAWAEEEGKRLREECENLEKTRREEWHAKELLLINLIEADLAVELMDHASDPDLIRDALAIKDAMLPETMLPMHGGSMPFYRQADNISVTSLDTMEPATGFKDTGSLPQESRMIH